VSSKTQARFGETPLDLPLFIDGSGTTVMVGLQAAFADINIRTR
jgi:hypothetical protein